MAQLLWADTVGNVVQLRATPGIFRLKNGHPERDLRRGAKTTVSLQKRKNGSAAEGQAGRGAPYPGSQRVGASI